MIYLRYHALRLPSPALWGHLPSHLCPCVQVVCCFAMQACLGLSRQQKASWPFPELPQFYLGELEEFLRILEFYLTTPIFFIPWDPAWEIQNSWKTKPPNTCIQPYQTTGWCLHISHILMLGLHPGQYSEKLDIVTLDIFFFKTPHMTLMCRQNENHHPNHKCDLNYNVPRNHPRILFKCRFCFICLVEIRDSAFLTSP